MRLAKEGRLIPLDALGGRCPSFAEFVKDFWDFEKSEYLKSRKARGFITKSYAHSAGLITKSQILPTFGKKRLDTITQADVDKWLTNHVERGVKASTANKAFERLYTIMNWAVFKKQIPHNPCVGISKILGLKGWYVCDNYILVEKQYHHFGYVDTKTHSSRNIPLPPSMIKDLNWLKSINGNEFLFSKNGGERPLRLDYVSKNLKAALEKIGINRDEQTRRKLTNHSFRYFLNTLLINKNVSVKKIQAVTGHMNDMQTDHYTSVNALEFAEVLEVQATILDTSEDMAADDYEKGEGAA
jgi:site-specific recombinase XerD